MKVLLTLLIMINTAGAASFSSSWNKKFEKIVKMSCLEDDSTCERYCNNKTECLIPENVCHNCIGTSVSITYIFSYLGLNLMNSEEKVSIYEMTGLLKSGRFVSLTAKSIYNHVYSYNSISLRRKFRSLCSNGARNPIVFFDSNSGSKTIGKVRFVSCDEEIFLMEDNPEIIINSLY